MTHRPPHRLPARAGIGLRAPHYRQILDERPDIGWFEVHSENFFGDGGQPHWFLRQFRERYACSTHGVGLALGSTETLDMAHLAKLKRLIERVEPALVSDHICWAAADGRHTNDLLPLPHTEEALVHMRSRVMQAQDYLGREILIENVSAYLQFAHSTIPEWEFVAQLARASGCGILLDVNNIYVNAVNHGFDPMRYLRAIPSDKVKEIHLAGFYAGEDCLIDTHGALVAENVWVLYEQAIARFGPTPTLIEWDTDLPALDVLLGEARRAQAILDRHDTLSDRDPERIFASAV